MAGTSETAFCLIIFLLFSFSVFYFFSKVVEVPLVPRKLVLEDAYIYRGLSDASKTTSYLHLRVGRDDGAYNYIIEASNRDLRHLDLSKSRKLLVAVDSSRNTQFIWGVYDEGGVVMINRENILQWVKLNNTANYFMLFTFLLLSIYLLMLIVRNGIWNRLFAKRIAHEDRAG
ncbi:hypothetical protein [Pseudomonas putida]|uniref:hypothetical protein n=1 Tax=Pseudomonas putida TaxID=303 RepID=UPI003D968000